ncbi:MAG: hypothetical protein EOP01_02980 [Propionibacteriaceae bacterium]|nr:MAG: hypothetical protein EOP01_02980 [Propionibacteriaceae bacterium]
MPRRLSGDVWLTLPGSSSLLPSVMRGGTREADLPPGVAETIVNPAAWEDYEEEVEEVVEEVVEVIPDGETVHTEDEEVEQSDGLIEPPRSGAGSSAAAWRQFAEDLGNPVPADATREQVIEALSSAGLIDAEG